MTRVTEGEEGEENNPITTSADAAVMEKERKPVFSLCCKVLRCIGIGLMMLVVICGLIVAIEVLRNSTGHGALQELSTLPETNLRLVTFNVHYIGTQATSGINSISGWEERKDALNEAFGTIQGDIIGFQEMETYGQRGSEAPMNNLALAYLSENNPNYTAAAQGDPDVFPSTQPIFYRHDRFSLLDEGWYFFSSTPDVIYSRTFNGSWPAFAAWAHFLDTTTGLKFRVVNLHTDSVSGSNRIQSAELVAERTEPWISAGEKVFVIGDFNAFSGSPTLRRVEEIGVEFHYAACATFHFNIGLNLYSAIDHIGHWGDAFVAKTTTVLQQKFNGKWPTDHYPVVVDFELNASS